MHPYLTYHLNQERIAEMRRVAEQSRRTHRARRHGAGARPGRRTGIAPAAIRNRAGWTLVHLGLRMVSGSADG
jgi:hypothetical protein